MSNCVWSSGLGLPASAVAQHGVKRGNHLARDGDKDDLGLLAGQAARFSRLPSGYQHLQTKKQLAAHFVP